MNPYDKVQGIVCKTVVKPPEGYRAGEIYGLATLVLITGDIVAGILETVPGLLEKQEPFFHYFQLTSVSIFTTEYALRLWSCVADPPFRSRGPVCGRVWAATRPLAVVDLLAILPFYLRSFVGVDLRVLRVLRLFHLFRVFRAKKMSKSFRFLSSVVVASQNQLTLDLLMVVLVVLVVSSIMYIIEQGQPDTKFTSIPASLWWGIITITTIGYGDIVPTSVGGKLFASFAGFLGICVFAIPAGIIGAGFATNSVPDAGPQVPPESGADVGGDDTPVAEQRRRSFFSSTRSLTVESEPASQRPAAHLPSASNQHGEAEEGNCYGKVQRIVYETVAEPPEGYRVGEVFGSLFLLFISANIVVGVLETVPSLLPKYEEFFYYFEFVSVVIFTVEYVLRLWSCVADPQFGSRGPLCGRLRAATRPLALADILAILPFYLSSFIQVDLRFVRVLRLFRIFRLFRSGKMVESMRILSAVITANREQLTMGSLIFVFTVVLVSSIIYIFEQDQPNTKFNSIPASMWWGVITITTIGYGDMVPDSPGGKVFASFVAFLGICVFAVPVGIIGTGFSKHNTLAAESETSGRTVSQFPPGSGAEGGGGRAGSGACPPAAREAPSSDLEMSAAPNLDEEAEASNKLLNCYSKVQRIVYETVVEPPEGYRVGEIYDLAMLLIISANIVVGILETVPSLFTKNENFFYYFELTSVVIFTIDYILMLWSSVVDPLFGSRGPVCGRVRAATRPIALVDILAILPFYLSSFVQVDLRFVRILRLFRIFRLFRFGKMAESMKVMSLVIFDSREQLTLGLLILCLVVLVVSSIMYVIEQGQPNTKFTSIPASLWWGIITVTTIGYGDMVPDSPVGKVFASLVSFLAIGVFAIPVGIIGAGFIKHSSPDAESETGSQVPSENGADVVGDNVVGDNPPVAQRRPSSESALSPCSCGANGASSQPANGGCPPAAQSGLLSDIEMSSASLFTVAAKEPLSSVAESQDTASQCPVSKDAVDPPSPSAADPHEEEDRTDATNCYNKVLRIVYETVVEPPEGYRVGEICSSSMLILISANVIVGVLETVPALFAKHENFFYHFEFVSVVIFTVEYILMLWSSVADPKFGSRGPVCGRVRAATRPLALIDILAIAPFYLSSFVQVDLRFIRILRLFRIFRLFRSGKMAKAAKVMAAVILDNQEQLTLVLLILILVVLLVSSLMYIIEQGLTSTKFISIPASMWWGIITITTIGYGDMAPDSTLSKVFAALVSCFGICLITIPIGIIGAGFIKHSGDVGGDSPSAAEQLSSSRLRDFPLRRRDTTDETAAVLLRRRDTTEETAAVLLSA